MKILLVEDDERLSRSLARLLVQDRHNVEVAADGETGLEIALGENGIDVVVLDIGLPDISGIEVARRIRRDKRDLAILMLTARDTVGDRVSGLDSGADDYVVKPFAYDELAARLRALALSWGDGGAGPRGGGQAADALRLSQPAQRRCSQTRAAPPGPGGISVHSVSRVVRA